MGRALGVLGTKGNQLYRLITKCGYQLGIVGICHKAETCFININKMIPFSGAILRLVC